MRFLTALVLAAFALSIAACGGDDDDGGGSGADEGSAMTTEGSQALSKQEFIEQGDEICREGNEEFERINEELDAISGGSASEQFAQAESILREGADLIDARIDDFRALDPPPEDAEVIDQYLDGVEDQRALLEQMADAAAAEDEQELQDVSERLDQVAAERRGIAQGYGFEDCGGQ
jgi:hypothetical protein